jgi:hypothetical protein
VSAQTVALDPAEVQERLALIIDQWDAGVAASRRETLQEFLDRKHDPNWKPAPLPKFRKLPRLSEEKFARLLAEHGGSGVYLVGETL